MTNILGAASTRWADYLGTAAADDADPVAGSPSIYELAGLDREVWTIVAVDLFVLNNPQVAVYARRQSDQAHQANQTAQADQSEDDQPVAVTQFRITTAEKVTAFLEHAFKTVAVRLKATCLTGTELDVVETVRLD